MKTGIWIDLSEANVVVLLKDKHSMITIPSNIETRERIAGEKVEQHRFGKQSISDDKPKEHRKHEQTQRFFDEVIAMVKSSDKIVVFGPGEVKKEIEKSIRSNKEIGPKLIGVETADSMTENQKVAWVKDYFHLNE